jgi:hypothetical protein
MGNRSMFVRLDVHKETNWLSLLKTRFVCRIDPLTAGVCALQPTARGNGVIFRGAGLVPDHDRCAGSRDLR